MNRPGPAWWAALAMVAAVVLVVQLPGPHATAWHFFDDAADRLTHHGLHLYVDHPEYQFGPLSVVVALPFTWLGGDAEAVVMVVGSGLALVVVRWLLDASRPPALPTVTGTAVTGTAVTAAALAVVLTWGDVVVRTTHIDDAVALLALTYALRAVARDRPVATTAALAVAAAAKPWAVMFVPLAAVSPGPRRWHRPVVAAAAAVATWVPFVAAAPATLDTSDFGIDNDPTSVLRALGIDAATTPQWVRPAQLVGGIVLVAALVLVGKWEAGVLAGVAWRLLLDPGAHRYYTAGFVIGALLLELRARPTRVPWFTIAGAVALELTAVPDIHASAGRVVRSATVVGALAIAAGVGLRATTAPGRSTR